MMYHVIVTSLAALTVAASIFVKKMDPIRRSIFVNKIVVKSGFLQLLHKTGLIFRMRPALGKLKSPDGYEIRYGLKHSEALMSKIIDLEVRHDDVFVLTYVKSGTTLAAEYVWLLLNDANTDLAKRTPNISRIPYLEMLDIGHMSGIDSILRWPKNKRRIIKSHLPLEFLPEKLRSGTKCKIIFVYRNPKDVCVSYYFFHLMLAGLPHPGKWEEFLKKFCDGEVSYGSWFAYVMQFWKMREKNDDRLYFLSYEDMLQNPESELKNLGKFLGKEMSPAQVSKILSHCSFKNMSTNDNTNYSQMLTLFMDFETTKFMRKGQVGDWKNFFTINQNFFFDQLYRERMEDCAMNVKFEPDQPTPKCT